MAPWYWLIFGLMMGDAGYGLMMAILIFAGKKLLKPKGEHPEAYERHALLL